MTLSLKTYTTLFTAKSTQTSHVMTKSMVLYVFSLKQQLISLNVTACILGK